MREVVGGVFGLPVGRAVGVFSRPVDFGRSYGVIAAQRLRLKAIAASVIWALALTRPT